MKMKLRMVTICVALLAQSVIAAPDQSKPYTPKSGSKERKAILDTLRKPVEKEMKQKVVFYDVKMKVKNGWAYVMADGARRSGQKTEKVDTRSRPYVPSFASSE